MPVLRARSTGIVAEIFPHEAAHCSVRVRRAKTDPVSRFRRRGPQTVELPQHRDVIPTEFQFHGATVACQSTSYEWLVVAGAKEQFKGRSAGSESGMSPPPLRPTASWGVRTISIYANPQALDGTVASRPRLHYTVTHGPEE